MSAEIWFKRDRLEIHVIANLCAGVAVKFPYRHEAAWAWGRILKDAVTAGDLEARLNGDEPNNQSTVERKALRAFATLKNDSDLLQFCDKWDAAHNCSRGALGKALKPPEDKEIGLSREDQKKGGSRQTYDKGLQSFISQLFAEFAKTGKPFTLSTLKDWLREKTDGEYPYETGIADCDDLEFLDNRLHWKDRGARPDSRGARSLEPYIQRAKKP